MNGQKTVLISSSTTDEELQLLDGHPYALSDGKSVWHNHDDVDGEEPKAIRYVLLSQEMFQNGKVYRRSIDCLERIIRKSDFKRVICYLHRSGDQIRIDDLKEVVQKANKRVLPIKEFSHHNAAVSKHLNNFRGRAEAGR